MAAIAGDWIGQRLMSFHRKRTMIRRAYVRFDGIAVLDMCICLRVSLSELFVVDVSELFVIESLHAGAERGVRNSSGSCDVALKADPAISGTEAKPPARRL